MKRLFITVLAISCIQAASAQLYGTILAGYGRSEFTSPAIESGVLSSGTIAVSASRRSGWVEPSLQVAFHQYGAEIKDVGIKARADYINTSCVLYFHLPAEDNHGVGVGIGPYAALNISNNGETLTGYSIAFFLRGPGVQLSGQLHRNVSEDKDKRFVYSSLMLGIPLRL